MRNVKVGIIGCGNLGKTHAKCIADLEGMDISAYCDVYEPAAKAMLEQFGGDYATTDLDRFFNDPNLDAIYVTTQHDTHADFSIRALEAGKHVLVEKPLAMTVEDCAEVSRVLSALLDVEDPIQGSYSLEVSSPGIDRPLVRPEDYTRFAGLEARIETRQPIEGRRRFRGRLKGVQDDRVMMNVTDLDERAAAIAIPLSNIERAKLVLTDELIKKSTQGRE